MKVSRHLDPRRVRRRADMEVRGFSTRVETGDSRRADSYLATPIACPRSTRRRDMIVMV